jgi:hypothetical protein
MLPFMLALLTSGHGQEAKLEVPVLHTRPSAIIRLLKGEVIAPMPKAKATPPAPIRPQVAGSTMTGGQGLIPQTVTALSSDDVRSVLIITGSNQDDLNDLARTIALFDVQPTGVNLKIRMESPYDKTALTSIVEIANNHPLTISDQTAGAELSVVARVNGDRTLTIYTSINEEPSATEDHKPFATEAIVIRVKEFEPILLHLDAYGRFSRVLPRSSKNETTETPPSKGSKVTPVDVTITPSVIDAPQQRAYDPKP